MQSTVFARFTYSKPENDPVTVLEAGMKVANSALDHQKIESIPRITRSDSRRELIRLVAFLHFDNRLRRYAHDVAHCLVRTREDA